MGTFKIEITAVGDHGQDRDAKDGEVVNFYKGGETKPDAIAKFLTDSLKHYGALIEDAKLTHWPGEDGEVIDDLLTGIRKGNF